MSGMSMDRGASAAAEDALRPLASATSTSSVEARSGADAEPPCEHSNMPADCAAMGVCVVFTHTALALQEWTADPHKGVFAITAGPASASRSPELPPPRWS